MLAVCEVNERNLPSGVSPNGTGYCAPFFLAWKHKLFEFLPGGLCWVNVTSSPRFFESSAAEFFQPKKQRNAGGVVCSPTTFRDEQCRWHIQKRRAFAGNYIVAVASQQLFQTPTNGRITSSFYVVVVVVFASHW